MNFTRTATPPNTDAKVTVDLAGLMVLEPTANDTCKIGIHRFAKDHTFQATLVVKKADRPPRLIRLQTGIPSSALFSINRYSSTPFQGVQAFAPNTNFNRNDTVDNLLDYRWGFNIRDLPGHATVTPNDGATPIVTLNSGILYSSVLSHRGQSIKQTCGTTQTILPRIAADLAFAIDLPGDLTQPGSPKVVINWSDFGKPQELVLPRPGEEGETTTKYTLSLLNDPAFSDPQAHDELELYYQVLKQNGGEVPNKCSLEIAAGTKSDQIPCLSVFIEP